jgi:hypothetical protein
MSCQYAGRACAPLTFAAVRGGICTLGRLESAVADMQIDFLRELATALSESRGLRPGQID